ncbi:MAG TPA: peptide ABC transporter substrate-binding protein, partial [Pseudolysinimonas sp.]
MTSVSNKGWRVAAVGSVAAVALVLAGCASGGGNGNDSSGKSIVIGTTDKVTFLDPAGSFDNGSLTVQTQVFATLMNSKPGTA